MAKAILGAMVIRQHPRRGGVAWAVLTGVCVVGTFAAWWLLDEHQPFTVPAERLVRAVPPSPAAVVTLPEPPALPLALPPGLQPQAAGGSAGPTDLPAAISERDRRALEAALAQEPGGRARAAEVLALASYVRGLETWRAMAPGGPGSPRHRLGEALMAEMPDRVAQGVFALEEAVMIQSVLLSAQEPDPARRDMHLEAWRHRLAAVARPPEGEAHVLQDQQRRATYHRRQATVFAEWLTQDEPQRDPAQLAEAMAESRRWFEGNGKP